MKTLSRVCTIVLLFFFVGTASAGILEANPAEGGKINWKEYSHAVVDGIRSENDGIRSSAMRLAIQYADSIDIRDATIDLMRIYRDSADDQERRMAAVALGSIGSALIDGYLRNCEAFEKNESIGHTLRALTNN